MFLPHSINVWISKLNDIETNNFALKVCLDGPGVEVGPGPCDRQYWAKLIDITPNFILRTGA